MSRLRGLRFAISSLRPLAPPKPAHPTRSMIRASVGDGTGGHGLSNRRSVTTTGAAAGHQGVDDAVSAALGEPGGFASQLRDGGRIAARAVGLNFGAKRVERAARAVGEDLEAWRAETNAGGEVFAARGGVEAGWRLCCALDGTGVPARPSETAGRAGKDGKRSSGRSPVVPCRRTLAAHSCRRRPVQIRVADDSRP